MTTPQPPDLAKQTGPGGRVIVRPFSHYAGDWRAVQKLRVASDRNFRAQDDATCDAWRTPRAAELLRLTGGDDGGAGPMVVEVFTFPNHLRNFSWDLDMDQVTAGSGETPEYRAFADHLLAYLEFIRVPVDRTCTIRAEISPPGGEPAWNAALPPVKNSQTPNLAIPAEPATVMLNFGFETRGVMWMNLDRSCPRARLALEPGEGCFGPLRQMRLLQDISKMTEPDVNLIVEPTAPEQCTDQNSEVDCHDRQ